MHAVVELPHQDPARAELIADGGAHGAPRLGDVGDVECGHDGTAEALDEELRGGLLGRQGRGERQRAQAGQREELLHDCCLLD